MNPRRLHASLSLLLMILVGTASYPAYGLVSDRILATVNKEPITLSDYQRFVSVVSGIEKKEDKEGVDELLLKRLIEEKIILLAAVQRGMEASDTEVDVMTKEFKEVNALSQEDFERVLTRDGLTLQGFRKLMKEKGTSQKLIAMEVDSKVSVTEKEIEDFYRTNRKKYLHSPEKAEVKVIFMSLKEKATAVEITELKRRALLIVAQLKKGESFDALAKKYSDEQLTMQEGKLGEFTRGSLIPSLDKKAFALKPGEISDPIWVSQGVYILRVTNRSEETYKGMEEVREEIREHLMKEKREHLFNEWMKTLWEKASVTIN